MGELVVRAGAEGLLSAGFEHGVAAADGPGDAVADAAITWLAAYLGGDPTPFLGKLAPLGTPFQQAVWTAVRAVRFGDTTTYGALAATVGRSKGAQAVGAANGANPWLIVVPCHRIVGVTGDLTGYAAGLDRKRWLLAHESRQPTLW